MVGPANIKKFQSGFGLISLLVTVAIIALLGGAALKFYFGSNTPAESVEQGFEAIDAAKQAKDLAGQRDQAIKNELTE